MKLAIVTGASRGIGRATALELARRGLGLAFLGHTSPELEETVALCLRAGAPSVRTFACNLADAVATDQAAEQLLGAPSVRTFACNLADAVATDQAAEQLLAEHPSPDVLINNAGMAPRLPIEETSVATWEETLAVNLRAPFQLARAVVPSMRRAKRGRIVFVGSISSTLGTARQTAYVASKWGVVGLMKSLAEELRDSGIVTLAVLPGSTDTRMLEGSGFPPRMTADDVAQTIVHYALDAPAAHSGSVIEMFGV